MVGKNKLFLCIISILGALFPLTVNQATASQPDIMEVTRQSGQDVSEFYRPKASIVISADTGQVLWEDNPDLVRKIASMSKLMTIYVALEKLSAADMQKEIPVTQKYVDIANNYNLSNNKMQLGASYTPKELLDLIIVPSSNAATVMLADQVVNGDDAAFVHLMNQTAAELGMKDSKFYNCAGAVNSDFQEYQPKGIDPNGDNESSPRDMAILVYHLLKKHPDILNHTKNTKVTVKAGTPYEEQFDTYLNSLPGTRYGYEGVDGLKTGSSPSAAFNYAATVKRDNMRLIEIIMGVGDWDHQECEYMRHPIGNAVLDYVYQNFTYQKVLGSGRQTVNGQTMTIAKDLYAVQGSQSTHQFALENNQIHYTNELPLVSTKLPPLKVAYTADSQPTKKGEQRLGSKTRSSTRHQQATQKKLRLAIGCLVVLVSLLFIILGLQIPSQKRRVHSKGSRRRPPTDEK